MTPEIESGLDELRAKYGGSALRRVEGMLKATPKSRHPLQRQARWIMPGLVSRPWHDPYEYDSIRPIVQGLERLHPHIQSEARSFVGNRPQQLQDYAHYKGTQSGWKALYLFRDGHPTAEGRVIAPETFRFMEEQMRGMLCPLLEMHFSVLLPGARIKPHCDLWNFTINLHLGVDIPPHCGIRVADEERGWREGGCLLFDYSYLHEAWNESALPRTCLLMDLWNPELTEAEREALVLVVTEVRRLVP